jgi:hypothetical protein
MVAGLLAPTLHGEEAQWIWSPEHGKESVPAGAMCHFRKTFNLRAPAEGQIAIAADDQYELFVNGRRVGGGEATRKLDEHDVSRFLARGANIIAVRVQNTSGSTAALVARVTIKDGGEWASFSSDASWHAAAATLEHGPLQRPLLAGGSGVRCARRHCPLGPAGKCPGRTSFAERAVHDRSAIRSAASAGRRSGRLAHRDVVQ